MVNKLEKLLLDGAKEAHRLFFKATEGQWLHFGPEHFIQVVICLKLMRAGYYSYPDTSVKRTLFDPDDSPTLGKEVKSILTHRLRPDITVWRKTTGNVAAVVEIKRTWSVSSIGKDAKKLDKIIHDGFTPENAYILAYSSAAKSNRSTARLTLTRRFEKWGIALGWACISTYVSRGYDDGSAWGFCLLKRLS